MTVRGEYTLVLMLVSFAVTGIVFLGYWFTVTWGLWIAFNLLVAVTVVNATLSYGIVRLVEWRLGQRLEP